MTESKLEQIDNTTFFSSDELIDDIMPDEDFFELNGKRYKVKGANGIDIFGLVKRFPKAQALFVNALEAMFGSESGVEQNLARLNTRNMAEVFLAIGDDAAAALVAICFFKKGDVAFEAKLKEARTDAFMGMLFKSINSTLGGRDPQDFFTGLLTELEALGLRRGGQTKRKPAEKANRPVKKTSQQAA